APCIIPPKQALRCARAELSPRPAEGTPSEDATDLAPLPAGQSEPATSSRGTRPRPKVGDPAEPWPLIRGDVMDAAAMLVPRCDDATMHATLCGGLRLPTVPLTRADEALLFDSEMRLRMAAAPFELTNWCRKLRAGPLQDFPVEVFLQRSGVLGRLLSLLRASAPPGTAPGATSASAAREAGKAAAPPAAALCLEVLAMLRCLVDGLVASVGARLDIALVVPAAPAAKMPPFPFNGPAGEADASLDGTGGGSETPRWLAQVRHATADETVLSSLRSFRYPQ
ncbi:unnamed protein product, partial [Phaeothamnion confervicola]